jgi:hypothetical protein
MRVVAIPRHRRDPDVLTPLPSSPSWQAWSIAAPMSPFICGLSWIRSLDFVSSLASNPCAHEWELVNIVAERRQIEGYQPDLSIVTIVTRATGDPLRGPRRQIGRKTRCSCHPK